jgi:hypothetical protein
MLRKNFEHGLGEMAWREAKKEALAALKQRAKTVTPITYSDLVGHITAVRLEPHDFRLAHFLGEISAEEHEAGRPLITALVVHKHDLQPGKGFFELARSLGFSVLDEVQFWTNEISKLQMEWK